MSMEILVAGSHSVMRSPDAIRLKASEMMRTEYEVMKSDVALVRCDGCDAAMQ